jgi:phosphate transporter
LLYRYDALKKYIYQLEKQSVNQPYRDVEANENSSLIAHADHAQGRNTDALFVPLLDRELEKISRFYDKQQSQAIEDVQELETLIHEEENRPTRRWEDIVEDEDDEDEDDDELGHLERGPSRSPDRRRRRPSISVDTNANGQQESAPPLSPLITSLPTPIRESGSKSRSPTMTRRQGRTLPGRLMDSITSSGFLSVSDHGDDHHAWGSESDYAQDTRLLFKRKITTVYVLVSSLKSYVELNYSGFRKILKK